MEIEENTMESDFEFLSEADMEGLGWSESLCLQKATMHKVSHKDVTFG